ncbi:DUF881 domain-containing protein [Actinotalea sp. C106]|uniref:DUF881 domain-containing protein n=1 Tax=Actinotalea sp. C106 TaxID=2908644 RepID=UPI002028D770|nr:DUF881 domain-containing protein [Actinotalea sp. C106]
MTTSQRHQHARPAVDASMSLLNEVMYRPVDPSYEEAARRQREEPDNAAARGLRTGWYLSLAVVLGLVTTTAIVTLRVPQPAATEGRSLLQEQIADRSAHVEQLRAENDELGEEVAALQDAALAGADPALIEQLGRLELASGAAAVVGPGLAVELDDPDADPQDARTRVQDVDLQIVTNALWAAGAEAIAINGQRLTGLSAIRGASEAILVDLQPLVAPYRVEAIGDPRGLQTDLARSSAANHLTMLSGSYGIDVTIEASTDLALPGASGTELRHASVPGSAMTDEMASSPPPDDGGES